MSKLVVIGGSAGSVDALKHILHDLPQDFPAAVLVAIHTGAHESRLPGLLARRSQLPVRHALQGEPILAGQVLLAPPDLHLTVAMDGQRHFARLSRGPKENHARPAIDPLFRSAATVFGPDAIGVVLSGFLDDGTVGLQAIKARGGIAVVQDPNDADAPDMPASAARHVAVDVISRVEGLAPALVELASGTHAAQAAPPGVPELPDWVGVESRMFEGEAGMEELDRIGTRIPLTCPECGGAIWEVKDAKPLRYRCHTGHAFTAQVLEALQGGEAEEALWAAVRALHEQEQLYREMHRKLQQAPGSEYELKADQAAEHAQLLRDLIATRMRLGPV